VLSVEALLAHGAYLAECPKLIGRQVRRRLLKGLYIDSNAYASAMLYRSYYLSEFLKKSFAGSRVLVLPVTPAAAPLVNETLTGTLKEVEEKFSELSSWTRAINYLGLPSITLPLGSDPDGLPLGLQLVGRPYDEEHLITIAQDIERGINNEF
jgi:aspartyl-tRNA(Asn)/glutamyl-tRNA(Gln) amidotransferase subunit A